jgi:acetylglutamate kinase
MKQLGKEPRFVDGRRITDRETLAIAQMVLAGQVNKELVAQLVHADVPALGVSGVDLGWLKVKARDVTLGFVGKVIAVREEPLRAMLAQGWVPVLASLGTDEKGQIYNVNADEVAAAVARAVNARRLIMVSDVEGIYVQGKWLTQATPEQLENYIAQGDITGGMIPKVRSAIDALSSSVEEVWIISGKKCKPFQSGGGTRLVKEGVKNHVAFSYL